MLNHPRIPSLRGIVSTVTAFAMVLTTLVVSPATYAQGFAQEASISVSFATPPKEPVPVYVLAGQSALVVFDEAIGRLAVSNTDVAEAVLVAPNQMMVNGKVSGRARFTAWSKDTTQFVFFDVDVRVNLAQIDSQVRALFPNMDIRLSQANGAVVISGNVPQAVMSQVDAIVKAAGYKTVNLQGMAVEDARQVQMQVKVAEVQRNKLSEFSYTPAVQTDIGNGGYANTGRGAYTLGSVEGGSIFGSVASAALNVFFMSGNTFHFIRALASNGALRALAEPNLVTMDGKEASFLAGGELPVPVLQSSGGGGGGSSVNIVWKEYGVRLHFKPQILDERHIRMEIEPEVSTLDYAAGVDFGGFRIPALRVRRAKTSIELADGQTFGIAGLLDNSETRSMAKIPVLSEVPVIGNLFKSKSFQKNESELVFIVTTNLIKPWNPDQVPTYRGVEDIRSGSPLKPDFPKPAKADDDKKNATDDAEEAQPGAEKPDADKKEGVYAPIEGSGDAAAPAEAPAATGNDAAAPAEAPATADPASPANQVGQPQGVPSNTSTPNATPSEKASEKVPSTPTTSSSRPTMQRTSTPDKGVTALQWKIKVPSTATVTAQTRP